MALTTVPATTAASGTVRLGSDVLLGSSRLKGLRVGVLCNHASVDHGFVNILDRAANADGVTLAAIFGPQHGFRSDVQDNMIETPHRDDARRRVPVYSLYSETREPTDDMLRGLDVLVVDLQDIGARIYTYIYTVANCLKACARHRIPVVICDRPNPINGVDVEGETLRRGFESFVGLFPIPMRHGLTMGEIARLFNEEFGLGAEVEVVRMEGWRREMFADDAGTPWVMPSPNMPTLDSAVVYPGTVLFEGTMLSEGRGTTRPFELVGAPWIDAERFARDMNALELPGAIFRPAVFEPTFHKHGKQACGGVQIHVTDRAAFRPYRTGVAFVKACRDLAPSEFRWRSKAYEFVDKIPAFDLLAGSSAIRTGIDAGATLDELAATWDAAERAWRGQRDSFLLYREQ
jgi:uncharacterized protein YbbC (DUF1343 family)